MSAAGTPSTDPWVILAKERARYEEQFRGLSPINGIVTGDQVKGFLLQSQLPPMVLGQIWSLADTDADGKMDISEFSIACKLINLKLRGFDVPKSLPPSLLASLRVHSPPSIPPLPVNHPPPSRPEPPHIQQQLPTMQPTMQATMQSTMQSTMQAMQPTMGIVQPQPQVGIVPPLANIMMPTTTMSAVNVNQPPPIPPLPAMQAQQLMMQQQQQSVVMSQQQQQVPIVPSLPASMMMGGMTSQPPVMMAPQQQQQVVAPSSIVSGTPRASVSSLSGLDSPQMEWSVPHHIKLKYTQIFNTTDRTRSGYLSGAQARNVMVQTKLPQNILAQVWGLSDMDNDGRLGCEEFVLAMHLCELASLGTPPPTTIPLDLIPPSFRRPSLATSGVSVGSNVTGATGGTALPATAMMTGTSVMMSQGRTSSVSSQGSLSGLIGPGIGAMGGGGGQGSVAGDGMGDLTLMQQQQNSFEDKRKENFEKGQAELERRRKALLEQQRKEREEHERKEREEGERRERARVEAERRRVEELERQMRETQERERQMEEERRRQVEQRETARREMERQRQLEWEKQRLQELQQQRQREQESVLRLKAKNQTLTIELTSLNDQVRELSQKICDTRVGVSNVKTTIDGMRSTRDTQMQDMSQLKNKLKEQNAKLLQMSQEKARMDAKNKQNTQQAGGDQQQKLAFENKEITIKNLREKIGDMQVQIDGKMEDIENNNSQLTDLKGQLGSLVTECESLYGVYEGKRGKVIELKGANRAMEYGSTAWKDDWGNTNTNTGGTPSNNTSQDSQWPVDNWSATSATPVTTTAVTTVTTDTSSTPAGDLPGSIKYRALYEFVQRNNDEISFQPGDIINVPKEQTGDPGWLAGEIRGHTGWFPESYVEPIDGVGVRETGGEITPSGGGGGGMGMVIGEEMEPTKLEGIEEVPETIPDTHSAFPAAAVTTEVAPVVTNDYTTVTPTVDDPTEDNYYIASYPYQSVEQGDLNFAAGDVIQVIVSEGDWWTGKIDDRVGIFPSNYVQKTDISAKTTATSQTLTNNNAVLPSAVSTAPITTMATPPTSAASVATYDSNTSHHNQLRDDTDSEICEINEQKQVGGVGGSGGRSGSVVSASGEVGGGGGATKTPDFTALTSSIAAGNNNQSAKAAAGVKKPEIASVIAPYEATSKEQLSLARGQLIMIRKKTDSGWWEGELQAKGRRRQVGWFPASYVKVMNSSGRVSGRTTPVSTSRVQQEVIIDKVVALYPYTAANPDELSFLKDDIISVTARDEPAWWRGELNGVSGLFPSNYVSPLQQLKTYDKMRMECINELIQTEKAYIEDMSIVHKIFEIPLRKSRIITEAEVCDIFVNWQEIIQCNKYFLDDLLRRSEKDTDIIGDVILNHLPRMTAYVTFCSRQLESAALLQHLTETSVSFKELVKRCQNNVQTKGMPLSSFLIKPMQRITKYPLLINKIIENTPEDHDDYAYLQNALQVADEFLKSVNENVRLKENQDRLEWMQASIQNELNITFNSCTNKLGQRRLIHYGVLTKVKSGKELVCFLLNDFLILVQASKALNSTQFSFLRNSNLTYKMYKQPILISELKATKASVESVENGTDVNRVLKLQDKKQVISLLAPTVTECNTWLKNIDIARDEYGKVTKSYKSRSKSLHSSTASLNSNWSAADDTAGDSWLTVTVLTGSEIYPRISIQVKRKSFTKSKGKSYSDNIYCKISVGEQEQDTDVARDNMLNGNSVQQHSQQQNGNNAGTAPVVPSLIWNHSMQFHVKNINNDMMTLLVYKLYPFSPDEFLGKAEVKIRDIYKESKTTNGPITKKLILHQVESGEVTVKLDFQRFSNYY